MPGDHTFDLLLTVLHVVGRDVHAACTQLGLTPMQGMLLDRLEDDVAAPMNELARQLDCDKSNLTGLVDALEERGLVERTTPASDRRVRALVTTEQGRVLRRQLDARLRHANPLFARLDAAEVDQLRRLLRLVASD